jgi:N-acetylneuraminic acid mutarotase
VAAAVFRGVVYVVGGFGGGNVAETYVADRWSAAPRYPIAIDHAMAAAVDTAGTPGLYVFGGNLNGVSVARSFRFFGDQGWREIAPMPAPRSQGAAVAIGGRIFVVGGAQGDRLVSPTYVYDTASDRWTTAASIPTPRDHLAAAAIDGRVCAVGGRKLSLLQNLATFECYDPATDAWKSMPDAPTARGGLGAATVGSRMVVAGGEQPLGTFKEIDIFDSATEKWTRGPDLPTSRHGLGVVAVGSTVYVMSGGPTPGGSQTAVCEALDVR